MTTLWARMLIFKAWDNGQVSEAAAKYFDQMIDLKRFVTVDKPVLTGGAYGLPATVTTQEELKTFNSKDSSCVMRKLGEIKRVYKDGNTSIEFSVPNYIQMTTFPAYTKEDKNFYLVNILGEEFAGLDKEIAKALKADKLPAEKWQIIKEYLENTYDATAKRDITRKQIVKDLLQHIDLRLKKLHLKDELLKSTMAPAAKEDFNAMSSYLSNVTAELGAIEAQEQEFEILTI